MHSLAFELYVYNCSGPLPLGFVGTSDYEWIFFNLGVIHFNYYDSTGFSFDGFALRIPYWLPMLATLAFVVWSSHRLIQFKRLQAEGRCAHCHYDLRAHNPGDLCPECGTPIPPQSATIIPTKGNPS